MERGYVQIYTGEGKGKSTAAFGLALRAAGAELRVYIGQFMKKGEYNEVKSLRRLGVTIEQYGTGGEIYDFDLARDKEAALVGYKAATEALSSGNYDVCIFDEINVAVSLAYLSEEDIGALVAAKPIETELIMTGRGATAKMQARADLVTYMKEIKHYYNDGVSARVGIED